MEKKEKLFELLHTLAGAPDKKDAYEMANLGLIAYIADRDVEREYEKVSRQYFGY